MNLLKIEKDAFLSLLKKIPACDNYHDSLTAQEDEYLLNYQFFKMGDQDLFGISPEGNLHIYSSNEEALKLFSKNTQSPSCKLIFSYYENDPHLKKHFLDDWIAKPFYYLKKSPLKSTLVESNRLLIRQADLQDQSLVNEWYSSFNQEEGSHWPVPDLSTTPTPRLFLSFLNEKFVGAAANTLYSEDRLWIGRLWIDKSVRNKGLGREIMQRLENLALQENKTINLLVSKENEVAMNFYESMNFDNVSLNCYWYKISN